MYAWLFVNMCSFLIYVSKYAVIISGICTFEDSRFVLLDFSKFSYWVIIKYCVVLKKKKTETDKIQEESQSAAS